MIDQECRRRWGLVGLLLIHHLRRRYLRYLRPLSPLAKVYLCATVHRCSDKSGSKPHVWVIRGLLLQIQGCICVYRNLMVAHQLNLPRGDACISVGTGGTRSVTDEVENCIFDDVWGLLMYRYDRSGVQKKVGVGRSSPHPPSS